MPHSFGARARTRDMFSRPFRQRGMIKMSTYMTQYKLGDYVDIKCNPAQVKGMPFKHYHGRTGQVYNITKRAVGVRVAKQVNGRIINKHLNVRVEHVIPSKCRDDLKVRVQRNEALKKAAKSGGAGWGRLPEHHKPRLRRAVAGPPKRPAHLTDELPAVYHLPTDRAAGAKVPKADRLAAEKLARNLHAYHKEAMAAPREGRAGLPAGLRREEKALPPGFHVLEPGQRLPKGAKIVKAPPLPAGYHVLKPGMKLPKGAKIVEHPPQLAAVRRAPVRRRGMKVPRVGQNNHMLDEDAAEEGGEEEGGEEPCECEEGDEECECPPAPRDVPGPCECAEDDRSEEHTSELQSP